MNISEKNRLHQNTPLGDGGVIAQNIIKRYGAKKNIVTAVNDVSISVNKGELFGIIGPDGAGKTSLFRVMTTLLLAEGGTASVDGFDVVKDYAEIRKRIGYMPGRFSLYQDLSVEENLEFFATIFNTSIEENYALIKDIYVQIAPFKKRKAGKLSGGMKQKLALCCALIHRPSVLFLDEPTTGVDAVSRKEFWEMLKQLKLQGITILVSTPYMDEAGLCDRVALMQSGKILSVNTPQGIIDEFGKLLYAVRAAEMFRLLKDMKEYEGIETAYPFGGYHHVILKEGYSDGQLKNYLTERLHKDAEVMMVTPVIEDCFMELMKN
jgi:ABC-2 type transport system ATP-binding protein